MTRRANPAQAALFDEPAADTAAVGFTPLAGPLLSRLSLIHI